MSGLRSYLGNYLPQSTLDQGEIDRLSHEAWRKRGVVVLQVDTIKDDWLRQGITNEANRRFGPRLHRHGE